MVFTGAGRRRDWPPEIKASIVAESLTGLETVSSVARRHGVSPTQLFGWRRLLRQQLVEQGAAVPTAPAFVPAVVPVDEAIPAVQQRTKKRRRSKASLVELEINGVAAKISCGADAGVIAAVIEAFKATR